jgi:hypothetical protein
MSAQQCPAVSAILIRAKLRGMGDHLITIGNIAVEIAVPAALVLIVWWLDT